MSKAAPPKSGVSKKAKKKRPGQYKRTKAHRKEASARAKKQRAATPPTKAQQAASRANAQLGGRPSDYRPEYAEQLVAYFNIDETRIITKTFSDKKGNTITKEEEIGAKLPTFQGFCKRIGVTLKTAHAWAKTHPEFEEAYAFAKTCQEHILLTCGLLGYYAQPMTMLFAKNNMGYREKVALTDEDGGSVKQEVTVKDELAKRRVAVQNRMLAVLERLGGAPA